MSDEVLAAIDIETSDPHLKVWGAGAVRRDGKIIGVGIYSPKLNLDEFVRPDDPLLADILANEEVTKVFHNGVYDLDWLYNFQHLPFAGTIEDTMTRETLLDSYAFSYSLDNCCSRHGVVGKNKLDTIDAYWSNIGGTGHAVEHLDKIPFSVVGKYCKQDCKATYDLYMAQQPMLEAQDLLRANDIECRLYPLLMNMRHNGIRLDWDARTALSERLNAEYEAGYTELERKYNMPGLSLNSASDLERIWKIEGIPLEYTSTGKPSFTADILADCTNPVAMQVHHLKTILKTLNTFVDGSYVDLLYNGRLYPTFYPAKRDDGGTVTGRWSSQDPNMQNNPAREDKFGTEIRSLFIPEENCLLGAFDYKQIEYRVFTHFASGPGAAEAQQRFRNDPDTDYHQMTLDLMHWTDRHLAKNFNFGSIYGLGYRSFAVRFKQSLLKAHPDADPDHLEGLSKSLMDEYFSKVTFAKPTCNHIQEVATKRGYVRTLSGRRQRLPTDGKTYKLVNYLIQGSASDILKKGLVTGWDDGVFDELTMHATVHDENVFSIPQTKHGYDACMTLKEDMLNAYQLKIPLGVDTEIGPNWGHCTMDNWKQFSSNWSTKDVTA